MSTLSKNFHATPVSIPCGPLKLEADLHIPDSPKGMVIFAHGSGSSRHSPRNRLVANILQNASLGTLLLDLLTREEEIEDRNTAHLRFDIPLLARRLNSATRWISESSDCQGLKIGLFGSSTGAAAALISAAQCPERVSALVSRGGRPDLAGRLLPCVLAPTLLIVGGQDFEVLRLNQAALQRLRCPKELRVIEKSTHLFEEPGALEQVGEHAASWFLKYLGTESGV